MLVDPKGHRYDPLTGQSSDARDLEPVESLDLFWFAWLDHHPQTQVYTENGTVNVSREPPSSSPVPGPGLLAVVGVLALAGLLGTRSASRRRMIDDARLPAL